MNVAERIKLRGTDLEVSRLCLGTMTFGGGADAGIAAAHLRRYLALAPMGRHRSHANRLLGER